MCNLRTKPGNAAQFSRPAIWGMLLNPNPLDACTRPQKPLFHPRASSRQTPDDVVLLHLPRKVLIAPTGDIKPSVIITKVHQPLAASGNFSIALFQCCGFDTNRWTKSGKCPIHGRGGFLLAGGHDPVPEDVNDTAHPHTPSRKGIVWENRDRELQYRLKTLSFLLGNALGYPDLARSVPPSGRTLTLVHFS